MAKKKAAKIVQMTSPENYIRTKARKLPLYGCWINADWMENRLASITVARKHSNGNITTGLYLADLLCLGLKETDFLFNITLDEFEERIEFMNEYMPVEPTDYELIHNIIYASIDYADEYGFKPHKDFLATTRFIIEEDTEEIDLVEIECGHEGQPMFVQYPDSNILYVKKIIDQLEKTAGKGNYKVIDLDGLDEALDSGFDEFEDEDGFEEDEIETEEDIQFKAMPFDEKRELYLSTIDEDIAEGVNNQNIIRFERRTRHLMDLVGNKEMQKEIYADLYSDVCLPYDEDEDLYYKLLGIDPDRGGENELILQFFETIDLISSKPAKAGKKVKSLMKKNSDIPAFSFLELMLFEHTNSPRMAEKAIEYIEKYPDYPLIRISWLKHRLLDEDITDTTDDELFSRNRIFPGREELHDYEIFQYLQLQVLHASHTNNMNKALAISRIIDEFDETMLDVELLKDLSNITAFFSMLHILKAGN